MAQTEKSIILGTFEAGDRPTDQNFLNLFDSLVFINNVTSGHNNGLSTANTSIEGNFTIGGNLAVNGTGNLLLAGNVGIGNTSITPTSPLHVYTSDSSEPVIYASGSATDISFQGISGDSTSSIKLQDNQTNVRFGTHTGLGFIEVGGKEIINITGSATAKTHITGSVGIGNATTPVGTLNVRGSGNINSSTLSNAFILVGTNSTGIGIDDNEIISAGGTLTLGTSDSQTLDFKTNASTKLSILSSGNVGIGNTTPTTKLVVGGNISSSGYITTTSNITSSNNISASSNVISGKGLFATNVGIGTTSPAVTLDVRGDVNIGSTPAIQLFDNNDVSAGPDIHFHNKSLLSATQDFIISIDSDNNTSTAKFSIIHNAPSSSGAELLHVSESGVISSSAGFQGDGSRLTGITAQQIDLFGGSPGADQMVTVNSGGTGLDTEGNLSYTGTDMTFAGTPTNAFINFPTIDDTSGPYPKYTNAIRFPSTDDRCILDYGVTADDAFEFRMVIMDGMTDKFKIIHSGSFQSSSFDINGNTALFYPNSIGYDNKVGIGTPSPSGVVHIHKSGSSGEVDLLHLTIHSSGDNASGAIRFSDSGDLSGQNFKIVFDESTQDLRFKSDDTDNILYLDKDGPVGIGTNAPSRMLDARTSATTVAIYGETAGEVVIEGKSTDSFAGLKLSDPDTSTGFNGIFVDGDLFGIRTDDSTRLTIDSAGEVGIGTTNPQYHLHVESAANTQAYFKSTDDGPTYIRLDTSAADGDTYTGVLFMENATTKGTVGYNTDENVLALVHHTGPDSTKGININSSGYVGIGIHNASERLHVSGTVNIVSGSIRMQQNHEITFIGSSDEGFIRFRGKDLDGSGGSNPYDGTGESWLQIGTRDNDNEPIIFTQENYTDTQEGGTDNVPETSATPEERMRIDAYGSVVVQNQLMIGLTGNQGTDTIYNETTTNGGRPGLVIKSQYQGTSPGGGQNDEEGPWYSTNGVAGGGIRLVDNDTSHYWDQSFINNFLVFSFYDGGTATVEFSAEYNDSTEGRISFTGQHVCRPVLDVSTYASKQGYIVSSNGEYYNGGFDVGATKGQTEPTVNESLPIVTLSNVEKDKKVLGVISLVEDKNTERTVRYGKFRHAISRDQLTAEGDERIYINSIGEGAIVVSNYNGNIENGDYITTSPIEGIGMKQDDDLLHNYTVAKITQDENFSSGTTNITYNGQTYKVKLVGCTYHCG